MILQRNVICRGLTDRTKVADQLTLGGQIQRTGDIVTPVAHMVAAQASLGSSLVQQPLAIVEPDPPNQASSDHPISSSPLVTMRTSPITAHARATTPTTHQPPVRMAAPLTSNSIVVTNLDCGKLYLFHLQAPLRSPNSLK